MIGQLYRLRAPSTGREIVLEAEPGRVYTDRDTGERLEVVGKVLPLAAVEVPTALGRGEPAVLQLVRPAGPEGPQRLPDVRPPYGRTAPLTLTAMRAARTASSLLIVALLAFGAAGCGGGDQSTQQVPGPPVDVPIPDDADALGTATATPSGDATPTPTPTATAESGTTAPSDPSGRPRRPRPARAPGPTTRPVPDSGGTTAPAQDGQPGRGHPAARRAPTPSSSRTSARRTPAPAERLRRKRPAAGRLSASRRVCAPPIDAVTPRTRRRPRRSRSLNAPAIAAPLGAPTPESVAACLQRIARAASRAPHAEALTRRAERRAAGGAAGRPGPAVRGRPGRRRRDAGADRERLHAGGLRAVLDDATLGHGAGGGHRAALPRAPTPAAPPTCGRIWSSASTSPPRCSCPSAGAARSATSRSRSIHTPRELSDAEIAIACAARRPGRRRPRAAGGRAALPRTRRAGPGAGSRRPRPQRLARPRRGPAHAGPRGRAGARRRDVRRLPRRRRERRRRHRGPQRARGVARPHARGRRGRRRPGAGHRPAVHHQRLPGRDRHAGGRAAGALPLRRRGPDDLERRAQGRALGRLDRAAPHRRRCRPHAGGDRRPRHRRLLQRGDLRGDPARRPHRRADRAAQPRRDAGPPARGDRPRAPRRHARSAA